MKSRGGHRPFPGVIRNRFKGGRRADLEDKKHK